MDRFLTLVPLALIGCGTPLPSGPFARIATHVREVSAVDVPDQGDLAVEVSDAVVVTFTTAEGPIDTRRVVLGVDGEDYVLADWLASIGIDADALDGVSIGTVAGIAQVDEGARKRDECCTCEGSPPSGDVLTCTCEFCE